ncbi:MAG: hypothetical protein RR370_03695, partial [Synergistaceae bacterium]
MEKFTLYLGLNDKDTKQQKIGTVEAYKIAMNILTRKCNGGTIYEAQGFYQHNDGTITVETTLRIELLFTDEATVKQLCDTLKITFNQESIAV